MKKWSVPKTAQARKPGKLTKPSKPTCVTDRRSSLSKLRDVGGTRRVLSKEQDGKTHDFRFTPEMEPSPINLDPGPPPKRKPGGQKGHKVNPVSLANLKRPGDAPRAKGGPTLTDEYAHTYVKFRAAGISALDAVQMFARGDERMKVEDWRRLAEQWDKDERVLAAWTAHNGGKWEDLDDEERTDIAMRMHLSQCARVLYTTDLDDPAAPMKKIAYAKDVITEKIALDKERGEGDQFTAFLERMVANAANALPPRFRGELPAQNNDDDDDADTADIVDVAEFTTE